VVSAPAAIASAASGLAGVRGVDEADQPGLGVRVQERPAIGVAATISGTALPPLEET
jgi:hypothetical protein